MHSDLIERSHTVVEDVVDMALYLRNCPTENIGKYQDAANRLAAFMDEVRVALAVQTQQGVEVKPCVQMTDSLWDQLVVLSGYHITRPPTPDHEFIQVCNGDLRKLIELMARTDQPKTTGESHPAGCVEEFYDGDEVAYLRDTLKEVAKERDHFYKQWRSCWAPLTPRSENEKQGFERVLAILKAKLADGGGIVGQPEVQRAHNDFYRGRRVAFEECATMLRSALVDVPAVESEPVANAIPSWKDQAAFEEWAATERYEMHQHPLHYLFLDPKTAAARNGWKAGMAFALSTRKGSAGDGAATITKGSTDE